MSTPPDSTQIYSPIHFHVRASFRPGEPEQDYLFSENQLKVALERAKEHPEWVPRAVEERPWYRRWFEWVRS